MEDILFLATYWGYASGGVNTFNIELCRAVSAALPPNLKLHCVLPKATEEQIRDAELSKISILHLSKRRDIYAEGDEQELAAEIEKKDLNVRWIIGHDVKTGKMALSLRKAIAQKVSSPAPLVAIIHHMDYEAYKIFQQETPEPPGTNILSQIDVLSEADLRFAVGPLLKDSAEDITGTRGAIELLPGLAETSPSHEIPRIFRAITLGRLEEINDVIKQTTLVVTAFAGFMRREERFSNAVLTLVGTESSEDWVKRLRVEAESIAGRKVNIIAIPYIHQRRHLLRLLGKQSLALMPSFREGFGLVGWEALSEAIPLVISESSGMFKLLEKLGGEYTGRIKSLDVTGVAENDTRQLERIISDVANNQKRIRKDVGTLRRDLIGKHRLTWASTATTFLNALGIDLGTISTKRVPSSVERVARVRRPKYSEFVVCRAGDRKIIRRDFPALADITTYYSLIPQDFSINSLEPCLVKLEGVGTGIVPMSFHAGEEFTYVLKGEQIVEILNPAGTNNLKYHLSANDLTKTNKFDSLWLFAHLPHGYRNLTQESEVISVFYKSRDYESRDVIQYRPGIHDINNILSGYGRKLKLTLERKNLSIEKLSKRINIDRERIVNLIEGAVDPGFELAERIRKALNSPLLSLENEEFHLANNTEQIVCDKKRTDHEDPHQLCALLDEGVPSEMVCILNKFQPVDSKQARLALHSGEEFIYIVKGKLQLIVFDQFSTGMDKNQLRSLFEVKCLDYSAALKSLEKHGRLDIKPRLESLDRGDSVYLISENYHALYVPKDAEEYCVAISVHFDKNIVPKLHT
jgi:transcriptional regulator with XRE-family HTH domain